MTAPADSDHTVVPFPAKRAARAKPEDLRSYSGPPESASEYRQRMLVNVAVFALVVGLIGAALWLANSMADMRRNQDCVLSGRHGCTHVDVAPRPRW